jgi:hypothetical protein
LAEQRGQAISQEVAAIPVGDADRDVDRVRHTTSHRSRSRKGAKARRPPIHRPS